MDRKNVLIIGCGLIGGSLAKSLKNRLQFKIYAYDINKNYIEAGIKDGIIDEFLDINPDMNSNALKTVFSRIDIIFLCTPAQISCTILDKIYPYIKEDTLVTDVCSTKEAIINHVKTNMPSLNFIGGHPMTGSEKDGYTASVESLFENAFYVLTPLHDITNNNKANEISTALSSPEVSLQELKKIVETIGAIPIVMDYRVHDYAASGVSHVPHIIAFALVNTIRELDDNLDPNMHYMHTLAAGGFKDITRIASSDPLMWENICTTNSKNIIDIIDIFISNLEKMKFNIKKSDKPLIRNEIKAAKKYRDSFSSSISGIIKPLFKLKFDVNDRIGTLSKLTKLLAENNINIKNINIENSRDFEGGCLELQFENEEQKNMARELLIKNEIIK